jgi:hypothetical protein
VVLRSVPAGGQRTGALRLLVAGPGRGERFLGHEPPFVPEDQMVNLPPHCIESMVEYEDKRTVSPGKIFGGDGGWVPIPGSLN